MAEQQHEHCSFWEVLPELSVETPIVEYKVKKAQLILLFLCAVKRIGNECHIKTDAQKEFLLRCWN